MTRATAATADDLAWSIAGEIERLMGSVDYVDTRTDRRVIGDDAARSHVLEPLLTLHQAERDIIAGSPWGHRGPYGPPVTRGRREYRSPETAFDHAAGQGVDAGALLALILRHESLTSRRWSGHHYERDALAAEAAAESEHWDDMAAEEAARAAQVAADLAAYRAAWDRAADIELDPTDPAAVAEWAPAPAPAPAPAFEPDATWGWAWAPVPCEPGAWAWFRTPPPLDPAHPLTPDRDLTV
jgi:hypothetical protein